MVDTARVLEMFTEFATRKQEFDYLKFEYVKSKQNLVYYDYDRRVSTSNYGLGTEKLVGYSRIGYALAVRHIKSIDLKSCNPLISIESYTDDFLTKSHDLKKVTIIADLQVKLKSKKDSWKAKAIEGITKPMMVRIFKDDYEDLVKMDFEKVQKKQRISFIVKPDMAPRLKAALTDLLKVHGVKPSKY